jgi:hypothetical protein
MKTVQSQMLEHRNQKGDLPREKSGGFGRGRNSAAKPEGRAIFNCKATIENLNREHEPVRFKTSTRTPGGLRPHPKTYDYDY